MLVKNFYILIYSICILKILTSLNTVPSLYAKTIDQNCTSLFIDYYTTLDASLLNEIKTNGVFKVIPQESRKIFEQALFSYYANKKSLNLELVPSSHIEKQHFDYHLFHHEDTLFTESLLEIKEQNSSINPPDFLQDLGYNKISNFYVFTSIGGSWTRGGGKTLKFKMPLNLKSLITQRTQKFFLLTDAFFKTQSLMDSLSLMPSIISNYTQKKFESKLDEFNYNIILQIQNIYKEKITTIKNYNKANPKKRIDPNAASLETAQEIISEYSSKELFDFCETIKQLLATTAEEIIEKITRTKNVINIIDLKIAYVSILSRVTRSYIPLDFWTGPHSHYELKNYLNTFRNPNSSNYYGSKTYTDDSRINDFIVESIQQYLKATEKLSFTLMFGYSELIPPIDTLRSDPLNKKIFWDDDSQQKGTPRMSALFDYLKQTGRQQELSDLGVKYLLFNNLEVLGPINLEIHAFKNIIINNPQYNSAFILVPRSPGYKGGFALLTKTSKKIIVEENNVDESIRNGYNFFNTNTAMFNLDTIQSSNKIGFEKKGSYIKVKGNLGDISFTNNTALIEGSVEENYFNFKGYEDYIDNGEAFLTYFTKWMEALINFNQTYNN